MRHRSLALVAGALAVGAVGCRPPQHSGMDHPMAGTTPTAPRGPRGCAVEGKGPDAPALSPAQVRLMVESLGPPPPDPPAPPCSADVKENIRRWFRAGVPLQLRLYRCKDLQQIKVWTTLHLETTGAGVITKATLTERGASTPVPGTCPQQIYAGQQITCFDGVPRRIDYPIHPCFDLEPGGVCR